MRVGLVYISLFGIMMTCGCGAPTTQNKTPLAEEKTNQKKFFSQDGQFRILFEEEPTAYARDIPYEQGKVRLYSFIYEKGVNLIYAISYNDYPENYLDKIPEKDFLYGLLKGYEETLQAGVDNQRNIEVNTYPGLYYQVNNGDTFVYGEYVLKNNRLFQLTVTKEGSYADEEEARNFLNSLELL